METLAPVFLLIFIYFIPSFVASARRHHNSTAIFMLNLLLGWTLVGWVISIVWASTAVERQADKAEKHEETGRAHPPKLSAKSHVEQLSELTAMHKSGAITDDEFTAMKAKIIDS